MSVKNCFHGVNVTLQGYLSKDISADHSYYVYPTKMDADYVNLGSRLRVIFLNEQVSEVDVALNGRNVIRVQMTGKFNVPTTIDEITQISFSK